MKLPKSTVYKIPIKISFFSISEQKTWNFKLKRFQVYGSPQNDEVFGLYTLVAHQNWVRPFYWRHHTPWLHGLEKTKWSGARSFLPGWAFTVPECCSGRIIHGLIQLWTLHTGRPTNQTRCVPFCILLWR